MLEITSRDLKSMHFRISESEFDNMYWGWNNHGFQRKLANHVNVD